MVARANLRSFPSWYKYDLHRNSLAIQVSQFLLREYNQIVSLKRVGSIKVAHLSRADLPGKERMFSINILQIYFWTHARMRAQAREYPFRGHIFSYKEVSDRCRNCKIALTFRRIKLSQQHFKAVPVGGSHLFLPIPVFKWSSIPHFQMSYSLNILCAAQKSSQPMSIIHFHFLNLRGDSGKICIVTKLSV